MAAGRCRRRGRRCAGVDEEDACAGVGEHRAKARCRDRCRERRDDDAGAQRAEEERRIARRVEGADRDRLARRDAVALQRCGDAVHGRVELAVVERARGVDERRPARRGARMLANELGDRPKRQVGRRRQSALVGASFMALAPGSILTIRSTRRSSAPARSSQRPVCTAEVWMIVLRGATSQWKRSRSDSWPMRAGVGAAGADGGHRRERAPHQRRGRSPGSSASRRASSTAKRAAR